MVTIQDPYSHDHEDLNDSWFRFIHSECTGHPNSKNCLKVNTRCPNPPKNQSLTFLYRNCNRHRFVEHKRGLLSELATGRPKWRNLQPLGIWVLNRKNAQLVSICLQRSDAADLSFIMASGANQVDSADSWKHSHLPLDSKGWNHEL